MKLKAYLEKTGLTYVEFGLRCGCAASTIGVAARTNKCSESVALQIMVVTKGKVRLKDFEILPRNGSRGNGWRE